MAALAAQQSESVPMLADRGELTLFLGSVAESVGASSYLLLTTFSRDRRLTGQVVAANWIFDAIQLVGHDTLGELTRSDLVMLPGARPRQFDATLPPQANPVIAPQTAALLRNLGHVELYCLRLNIGRAQAYLILSAAQPGAIDAEKLGEAQMRSNYALSDMSDGLRLATLKSGLLGRERECLAWAAEGKTSEEIAVILGLPASTANAAITLAMEKLHARNRVEAVATAIRTGIL